MKKFTLIITAFALLLSFSQCKKGDDTPSIDDNLIKITLNANYGNNGGRTTFDPLNGSFAWSTNSTEYIYVSGSVSGRIGYLNNSASLGTGTFDGSISTPQNGETLYFFYLGNGHHYDLETYGLDFSDQSNGTITDHHIAIGSQVYNGQSSFNVELKMAMAIACFDLSDFTSGSNAMETVYIHGDDVYSTATIDFKNGTITGNSKGFINVGKAGAEIYVALIPSVTTPTDVKFDSNSKSGSLTFLRGIKPASYYSNNGSALEVTGHLDEGVRPGLFTVSDNRKVRFSKGNLQYQASTDTWRFAENQWDYVGEDNALIGSPYYDGWIDLFGWGTSGYHDVSDPYNVNYQPCSTSSSTVNSTYNTYGYGPSMNMFVLPNLDLVGTNANYDWGVYNRISNGGNQTNQWHTLTYDEWWSLAITRKTDSGIRYAKAKVNNVFGVILLPDDWSTSTYSLSNTNGTGEGYSINTITAEQWTTLEDAGAVFLPNAGGRNVTSLYDLGRQGYYWLASAYSSNQSRYVIITSTNVLYPGEHYRNHGCSVRLVRDVE